MPRRPAPEPLAAPCPSPNVASESQQPGAPLSTRVLASYLSADLRALTEWVDGDDPPDPPQVHALARRLGDLAEALHRHPAPRCRDLVLHLRDVETAIADLPPSPVLSADRRASAPAGSAKRVDTRRSAS